VIEAIVRDRSGLIAEDHGGLSQSAFGWHNADVDPEVLVRPGDRNDHATTARTGVEPVIRDDQKRPAASLLVPDDRIEITEPHLASPLKLEW